MEGRLGTVVALVLVSWEHTNNSGAIPRMKVVR